MLDSAFINRVSSYDTTQPLDGSRINLDDPPSPRQKWILTPESFDGLLLWLDPDRERAGEKYEEIRSGLIRRFRQLSCSDAEELANKTFDRVAKKLPEIVVTYKGNREPYFFSVAYNIYREDLRKPIVMSLANTNSSPADLPNTHELFERELLDSCLRHCLEQQDEFSRNLITNYYRGNRQDKIRLRKELAKELNIKLTNLRLRAQRIRTVLKKCILACIERKAMERELSM